MIQLFGQASVVSFYVMAAIQTAGGSYTPSMVLAMALLVLSLLIVTQLKDPQLEQD